MKTKHEEKTIASNSKEKEKRKWKKEIYGIFGNCHIT